VVWGEAGKRLQVPTLKTPRIGVDARPLCHPGTGIYRYTYELLSRMCPLGGEWFLYSAQDYDTAALNLPNVHHRVAGVPARLRASQSAHLFFPRWTRKDKLDAFWGPRHQLPLMLPSGIRAVVTVHDMVWRAFGETMRFPGRQIEAFFMPRALKRAQHIAVVSEFTAEEVRKYYPKNAGKVVTVAGASLLQASTFSEKSSGNYFLFVGTLEPRKNLPRLLRAYAALVRECPNARKLLIAGARGWGGQDVAGLVQLLGLEGRVEILGSVDDHELMRLYAGAYALLMPSLYEGFGLPVVEAMSMGVPAVVSRDSALSEVAGMAGLPVDPLSEGDIRNALRQLDTDIQLRTTLGSHAMTEAGRYDWHRSAVRMFGILTGDANPGRL